MGNEPCHDLDERFDREGLAQHRIHSESVGLCGRLLISRANDDRRRLVALLDTTNRLTRAPARVSLETDEIGDDKIGSRVCRGVLEPVDQQQLVALIAQHLAEEVSSGAVVLNDQDLSYLPHVGGFGTGAQC